MRNLRSEVQSLDLRRKRKNVGQKESDALVHRSADRAPFFPTARDFAEFSA
jgi:hypothetical protein